MADPSFPTGPQALATARANLNNLMRGVAGLGAPEGVPAREAINNVIDTGSLAALVSIADSLERIANLAERAEAAHD